MHKDLRKILREGSAEELRDVLLADSRVVTQGGSWRPDGRHPDGGASLLWEALHSERERDEKLRALVNAGADIDSTALPKGTTLLNWSLLAGDLPLMALLLSLDADVAKRDRRGLTSYSIAVLREDFVAQGILGAAGAPEAEAGTAEAEQAFILERPVFAELHETIKWSLRNAGLELFGVRIPAPWGAESSVLYRVRDKGWTIRLTVGGSAGRWSVSLALEDFGGIPIADLLPSGESFTNTVLRGHLATWLKRGSVPGGFASAGETPAPEGSPFAVLGLSAKATREEITQAYRKLAKAYHPDRAGAEGEPRMKELNRAYEEVAKKKR